MSNKIKQKIVFYSLEELNELLDSDELLKLDLKTIGVKLEHNTIVSSLMFKKFHIKQRPHSLYIIKDSYDETRKELLIFIIEEFIVRKQKGNAKRTLYLYYKTIENFIIWLNSNNLEFPLNINQAQKIFHLYVLYLRNKIKDTTFSYGSAQNHYSNALDMLKTIFDDRESIIDEGIDPIKYKRGNTTPKSEDKDMIYSFNFYTKLFNQLADFIIKEKDYPFKLKLVSNELWVFPVRNFGDFGLKSNNTPAFDYSKGIIKNVDEIKEIYEFEDLKSARQYRNNLVHKIKRNNINKNSNIRMYLGTIAMKAYFMHFLALTGMNDSTAATLKWDDEYNIEKEQYNFRNIKYRAGNKPVEYSIRREFILEFKKFVKIRDFLLDGHKNESLFFISYKDKARVSAPQKRGTFNSVINNFMKDYIDKDLPIITSRKSRVNKNYIVSKEKGYITAANLSQNSVATTIAHYSGEGLESTTNQFSEFFEKLNSDIIFDESEGEDITAGQCKKLNNPDEIMDTNIKPDCNQVEGCLFCDKFGIHADEIDIRKLFSLEFLIHECKYISNDEDLFNKTYGLVLERIKYIFQELLKKHPYIEKKIKEIKSEVYEKEILTPYFEHKLNILDELGVI